MAVTEIPTAVHIGAGELPFLDIGGPGPLAVYLMSYEAAGLARPNVQVA